MKRGQLVFMTLYALVIGVVAGFVAAHRLDLPGVLLGLGVIVGAEGDFVDDVFLVQKRLRVIEQHVGARVIDGSDAGLEDADDFGDGSPALRAGERDVVVDADAQRLSDA